MRSVLRSALPLLPLVLIGCREESMAPGQRPPITRPAALMEITITSIGTPQQTASVRSIGTPQASAAAPAPGVQGRWSRIIMAGRFSPLTDTSAQVNGTVQLDPVSTASFTWGTRAGGGYRYVSATYRVRNASDSGTAYGDARHNLTFVGTSTVGTLNGTAISVLRKFNNDTTGLGALATQVLPTGWADLSNSATLTTRAPDVLQAYTEAEVAASGIAGLLPYGFVVTNPGLSVSRTLSANPGASQFDGLVTFAFKVPLQATAADDPFTITGVFFPVDDAETWVTQSFEEADATSTTALLARATALGAQLRSVAGPAAGVTPVSLLCRVRIGGTSGAPTGFMADSIAVASLSPAAFTGAARHIDSTGSSLSATFTQAMAGATASSFVVNGGQSGRAFLGGTFGGAGTTTLSTPGRHFWPGDQVEVTLTPGLAGTTVGSRACPGFVYRYQVVTATATANYSDTTRFSVGNGPFKVAVGDVDNDGDLDIVTADYQANTATVLLGNGTGGFSAPATISAGIGTSPFGVVLADVNADGKLDLLTANVGSGNLSVLLGDGSGGFAAAPHSPFSVGADSSYELAVGDVNGDGRLDIVSASSSDNSVSVLLGDGTGNFAAAQGSPIAAAVAHAGFGIALGDVNQDGRLDIIVPNSFSNTVTVLLGNGDGTFAADPSGPFTVGSAPNSVVVADFNGDGALDIVTGNEFSGTVSTLLGNGAGNFSSFVNSTVGGSNTLYLAVGDVNGDGNLDIMAPLFFGGSNDQLAVLLGDGSGAFSPVVGGPFTVGTNPSSVAVGDFNGDGELDLVTANRNGGGAGSVMVLLNP